ncbi:MAG: family 10 glycosylhydrolase [Bacteroidaceae bacterium]|nr:family 10 glycosylhydrolase [Bacteroidaceae bacterium]
MNKTSRLLFLLLLCLTVCTVAAQSGSHNPKREFRGAWVQIINGQFQGLGTEATQRRLTDQLNAMQQCGINVVMFQVRGEADAMYASQLEPWSRFLTGKQGTAPSPYWDPLAWMIHECHKRGMELHAWINPYRAKTKGTKELAVTHPYVQCPERFFSYDDLLIFDPALQENRNYICRVVQDIVSRYDVDGLHIDDYFYPYPVAGKPIPDDASFRNYGNGISDRGDWRRYNVNLLIEQLHRTIHATKPWVKFGVSPFGIYHNQKAGDRIPGSETGGLQNYDDLYADVLYWINKGWVDYTVPQVYWENGHKTADYDRLCRFWAKYAARRPLVIGQDIDRTVKHGDFKQKLDLQRSLKGVSGSCMWYSAALAANTGNYAAALKANYHQTPALQPLMPFIDDKAPAKVKNLKALWMPDGYYLFWTSPKATGEMERAHQYVVYAFAKGEKVDINDPSHIMAITNEPMYKLPFEHGQHKYTYVVTALDRLHNESKAAKKKIKL